MAALSTPEAIKDMEIDPAKARATGAPGVGSTSTQHTSSIPQGHATEGSYASSSYQTGSGGKKAGGKSAEDKKKLLLTAAGGVALVAAIVLGVKKARENREEDFEGYDRAKANADAKFGDVKHKLSQAKHEVAKVVPQPVKDAGHATGHKIEQAKDKVDQASLDFEKKGMKASEKSDHSVRKAYDKTAGPREDAKHAAHDAKAKTKDAANKVQGKAEDAKKDDGPGCTIM